MGVFGWLAYGVGRSLAKWQLDERGSRRRDGAVREGTEEDFRRDEARFAEDEKRLADEDRKSRER